MDDRQRQDQATAVAGLLLTLTREVFVPDSDVADLPLAQVRVCGLLYAAEGPRPMSALGRELSVSLSAMTQLADRMERAGLVTRVADEADRRVKCLQLTDRARRMLRAREKGRIERVATILEHLPPVARGDVVAVLESLVEACAAARNQEAMAVASE